MKVKIPTPSIVSFNSSDHFLLKCYIQEIFIFHVINSSNKMDSVINCQLMPLRLGCLFVVIIFAQGTYSLKKNFVIASVPSPKLLRKQRQILLQYSTCYNRLDSLKHVFLLDQRLRRCVPQCFDHGYFQNLLVN